MEKTREHKYRAWDEKRKLMIHEALLIGNIGLGEGSVVVDERTQTDNPLIWLEYTGLKDKNDKEIYEGHICMYWMDSIWKVGVIVWSRGGWAIHVRRMGKKESDVLFEFQHFIPTLDEGNIMGDEFEICGNIYENPELLK